MTVVALLAFVAAGLMVAPAPPSGGARQSPRAGNRVADRAGAGDVQLHRLERRRVRRRGGAQPDAKRAAGARVRHRQRHRALPGVERALLFGSCRGRNCWARSPSASWRRRGCSDRRAAAMFAGVAIVIILSSLSAWTLAGPRIYFAMARDGVFFASAARVHPQYRTPAIAILAQTVWSTVLVLSGHVRAAADLHRLLGDPVFSAGGAVVVLRADSREGHRYVPGVGLSVGARDLLRRELCDRRQHDRQRTRAGLRRPRRDGGRRADLLVDGSEGKGVRTKGRGHARGLSPSALCPSQSESAASRRDR